MLHREQDIIQWAKDRNIFVGGTPVGQATKTLEEAVELLDAINKRSTSEIADAIGDIMVTLIIQAKMWKLDMSECIEQAYNAIKDRRGIVRDGIFIKDVEPSNGC